MWRHLRGWPGSRWAAPSQQPLQSQGRRTHTHTRIGTCVSTRMRVVCVRQFHPRLGPPGCCQGLPRSRGSGFREWKGQTGRCLGLSLNPGNLFGFWEGLWLWNRWGSPRRAWMARHQPRVLL